jgi:dTDP-glucose pyrophosphorylase/CBS domain-containing protein
MKNWSEILLKPEDSIQTSIEVIHAGGNRIALVVDDNGKLLGVVTDGDIRRALIKHTEMGCAVKKIMNSSPITALMSKSTEEIMLMMKNESLLHIPLVDKQGILVGLETLQHLLENKKYDNYVFILAGGFGTRLHPLTKDIPKPLLDVGSRPILATIIGQFIDAGFHKFYISTHFKAEMIRDYFGDGSTLGVDIEYVYEEEPLGTAGSLALLPNNVSKLPIIVMNGDLLTKVNFEHLLAFHNEQDSLATMCIREYDFQVPYGVVDVKKDQVASIVEKPVHKFFVNAGVYVLEQKLINTIDVNVYLDMPNFLENKIKKGEKINVFPIHEYWLDIGKMDEYKRANREFIDIL